MGRVEGRHHHPRRAMMMLLLLLLLTLGQIIEMDLQCVVCLERVHGHTQQNVPFGIE